MNAAPGEGRPTLDRLVAAVEYAVNLMGIDHVGIGTDHSANSATKEEWETMFGRPGRYPEVTGNLGAWFGFETRYVDGLHSIELLPRLTDALLRKGYAEAHLEQILGGNVIRLFSEAWR